MAHLLTAVEAGELAALEQQWGPAPHITYRLQVDHPFLSGQHQMLLGEGIVRPPAEGGDVQYEKRRAEICYVMYRDEPQPATEQASMIPHASEQAFIRKILLHIKTIYPDGAFRLPTGGIRQGEPVLDTLVREIWEETGLTVGNASTLRQPAPCAGHLQAHIERFLGVVEYALEHLTLAQTFAFATYHFLVRMAPEAVPEPQDASELIAGWQWRPVHELGQVAAGLEQVGIHTPPWADWGNYRAASHRFVSEQLASV